MYRAFCIVTALVGGVAGGIELNSLALGVAPRAARSSGFLWSDVGLDRWIVGMTASATLVLSVMMVVQQLFRRTDKPHPRGCWLIWFLVSAVGLGELWLATFSSPLY